MDSDESMGKDFDELEVCAPWHGSVAIPLVRWSRRIARVRVQKEADHADKRGRHETENEGKKSSKPARK